MTVHATTDVTGCADCPFLDDFDGTSARCMHPPGFQEGPHAGGDGSPDWCPLRKGPVTIAFRERKRCPATKLGLQCIHVEGHATFIDILRNENIQAQHRAESDGAVVTWGGDDE